MSGRPSLVEREREIDSNVMMSCNVVRVFNLSEHVKFDRKLCTTGFYVRFFFKACSS